MQSFFIFGSIIFIFFIHIYMYKISIWVLKSIYVFLLRDKYPTYYEQSIDLMLTLLLMLLMLYLRLVIITRLITIHPIIFILHSSIYRYRLYFMFVLMALMATYPKNNVQYKLRILSGVHIFFSSDWIK